MMSSHREQAKINVIHQYFKDNFSYTKSICFLKKVHGLEISLRHLHRILRGNGLSRRKEKTSLNLVMYFAKKQQEGTSLPTGYCYMHLKA